MPPILEDSPTAEPKIKVNQPVISKPEYKGLTVDTRYQPTISITTHVEGSSWSVNYYSQILDSDSAIGGQSVNKNAIYQQYRLIKDFELKVTSPLSTSQDESSKSLTVTGSANVYPFLIPNEGDMFLADIGDGREGIFKVTSSERKTFFKETVHVIGYTLIDYSTEERIADLKQKTIDTLVFIREFLLYGQNPLLQEQQVELMMRLRQHYSIICERYFRSFLSNEFKTLILPSQTHPVYDHYLVKAIRTFFNTYDSHELSNVKILNCDGDDIMKTTTLWDVLRERDRDLLKFAIRKTGIISARNFEKNPMLEGIYHSGIHYVVYPKDPELMVDYQIRYNEKAMALEELQNVPSKLRRLSDLIPDTDFEGLTLPDLPVINKVLDDDHYILSEKFYNEAPEGKSMFEVCVDHYIDHKAPNMGMLLALCTKCHSWGALERFYFMPILLLLVKTAVLKV